MLSGANGFLTGCDFFHVGSISDLSRELMTALLQFITTTKQMSGPNIIYLIS